MGTQTRGRGIERGGCGGGAIQTSGRGIERGLFWIERTGIFCVFLYWIWVLGIASQRSTPKLFHVLLFGFLTCINNAYYFVFELSGRGEYVLWGKLFSDRKILPIPPHVQAQVGRPQEECGSPQWGRIAMFFLDFCEVVRNSPGFWVERVVQVCWAAAAILHCRGHRPNNAANLVENTFFIMIFSLLNVYFACFGYSKEFQKDLYLHHHHHQNVENRIAREDIAEIVECCESLKKDIQRLEEEKNELALKLSAATTASQIYRSLLHDC